jgi:hypothetical protein
VNGCPFRRLSAIASDTDAHTPRTLLPWTDWYKLMISLDESGLFLTFSSILSKSLNGSASCIGAFSATGSTLLEKSFLGFSLNVLWTASLRSSRS